MKWEERIIWLVVLLFVIIYYNQNNKASHIMETDSLKIKCDSLKKERNTLKDSITKIDTTIIQINKSYEKVYNTILSQSTDSDCVFFSDYISKNSK